MKNKKALSAYLIVLLISSLVTSLLFLLIFDSIYEEENIACQNIKLEIENICLDGKILNFLVVNRAEEPLNFLLNGANEQSLTIGESKKYKLQVEGAEQISIRPIIKTPQENFYCDSKKQELDLRTITKIC